MEYMAARSTAAQPHASSVSTLFCEDSALREAATSLMKAPTAHVSQLLAEMDAQTRASPTESTIPDMGSSLESADGVGLLSRKELRPQESAETLAFGGDDYSMLPQLPKPEDHIAVVQRLLFEIRDLQAQVSVMSGELRQARMVNASLRAAVQKRDDEAMRNAEEKAADRKTIEGLKQVVKGLREAWAQERKRSARTDAMDAPGADFGNSFYGNQGQYGRYEPRQFPQQMYQQQSAQLSHHSFSQRSVWAPQPQYPSDIESAFRNLGTGS
ncbi:hypothetical protein DFJ74DRAFT_694029 [Hyaloraphidium curvatum]|nr:hypothetical protein DFJ74DRAFT_694029 [Hyaloraphidium curvatum]